MVHDLRDRFTQGPMQFRLTVAGIRGVIESTDMRADCSQ